MRTSILSLLCIIIMIIIIIIIITIAWTARQVSVRFMQCKLLFILSIHLVRVLLFVCFVVCLFFVCCCLFVCIFFFFFFLFVCLFFVVCLFFTSNGHAHRSECSCSSIYLQYPVILFKGNEEADQTVNVQDDLGLHYQHRA